MHFGRIHRMNLIVGIVVSLRTIGFRQDEIVCAHYVSFHHVFK